MVFDRGRPFFQYKYGQSVSRSVYQHVYDVCVDFIVKQIVLGNMHNINVLTGSSTLDSGLSESQEF